MNQMKIQNLKIRIAQHLKIYRPDWNRQIYIDELDDKSKGDPANFPSKAVVK